MKQPWLLKILFCFGMCFLYLPIITLIVYSFNDAKIVSIWGGWSLRWYHTLAHNNDLLQAAWRSIQIGITAATLATILGLLLAIVTHRYHRFQGRSFLISMSLTPLVMPDVVTGLSLLFLFITLQQLIPFFQQGLGSIMIAHTTFCGAYAFIMIRARLTQLDRATEEAAMDLGAKPLTTFFAITLPQMTPSLISTWLMCMTLSLDDLVITSFVSGPGDTTLPMFIFSSIKTHITPEINALSTIMIVFILCSLSLSVIFNHKKS